MEEIPANDRDHLSFLWLWLGKSCLDKSCLGKSKFQKQISIYQMKTLLCNCYKITTVKGMKYV